MGFRRRLTLFVMLTLATVQILTAVSVYVFTRNNLIAQGKAELTAASGLFVRQLQELGTEVADSVQILVLDYAFRQAIAQQDSPTVLSTLRNHGRRVGAGRMLLVGLDNTIKADTLQAASSGHSFPFTGLLDIAVTNGRAASVVSFDDNVYWLVVVPVLAPEPIAFIAAAVPLDSDLLHRLQGLAAVQHATAIVTNSGEVGWNEVARTADAETLTARFPLPRQLVRERPQVYEDQTGEELILATQLKTPPQSIPVYALLSYPLAEALQQYRPILLAAGGLLLVGLAAAFGGALFIARSVALPVETLAEAARRFETGDYTPPSLSNQHDEIGHLATALAHMARTIGEREERIRHQASHDATTGLRNRIALEESMTATIKNKPAALVLVGLSRLQEIIDTVGHEFGDQLVFEAGQRVTALAGDAMVARIGDSDFGVFLPNIGATDSGELAQRMIDAVQEPYRQGALTVDVPATAGIALHPTHGSTASLLLQRAEVAMHLARGAGRQIGFYDPASDPHRPERLSLMADLREALDHGAMQLYYQPKLDLATGLISGAEALVRWNHPKRGFVPPDDFITLAEETGNIQYLTRWVLDAGIAQAAEWRRSGLAMRIAINISVRDLTDTNLPERVETLLKAARISAENLTLEITETAIMGEPDAAIVVLRRLADLGIDLSIDDFGVGQSSFSYLRRLPVRELKIDKSFVIRLSQNTEDATIVRSVIELGHQLGYKVTAEGVEDEIALTTLGRYGCDFAQGYHIAKPLPVEGFNRFLTQARWPGERMRSVS